MSRAKRGATTDLNHDNWDQEEDKEEAGVFKQAPPEEINRRVIKQAVRRRPVAVNTDNAAGEVNKNIFGSLNMKSFATPEAKPNAVFKAFNFLGSSESKVAEDIPIVNQKNETAGQVSKSTFESSVYGKVIPEAKPALTVPSFDFLSGVKDGAKPFESSMSGKASHGAKPAATVPSFDFLSGVKDGTKPLESSMSGKASHGAKPAATVPSFDFLSGAKDGAKPFESSMSGKASHGAKPAATVPSFDFLSGVKDGNSSVTENSNGIKEVTTNLCSDHCPGDGPDLKTMHERVLRENDDKEQKMESVSVLQPVGKPSNKDQRTQVFSSPSSLRDFVEPTYRKYSHLISKPPVDNKKIPGPNNSGRSEGFLQNMAEINESFSTWIQKNLAEDPTGILTRCFKDYIRHVQALFDEEKKDVTDENDLEVIRKQERVLNELVILETPQTVAITDSEDFDK